MLTNTCKYNNYIYKRRKMDKKKLKKTYKCILFNKKNKPALSFALIIVVKQYEGTPIGQRENRYYLLMFSKSDNMLLKNCNFAKIIELQSRFHPIKDRNTSFMNKSFLIFRYKNNLEILIYK